MKRRYRIYWLRELTFDKFVIVNHKIIRVWQQGESKPHGLFLTDDLDPRNYQDND